MNFKAKFLLGYPVYHHMLTDNQKKQKVSTSNPPPDFSEVQPLLLEKPGRAENRMRAFLAFTRGFSQTCTNKQNLPPYVFFWIYQGKK